MKELLGPIKIIFTGKLFISLTKFIIGVLTARYLGPSGKGLYLAFTRFILLTSQFLSFSSGEGLVYSKKNLKIDKEIFGFSIIYSCIFSTLACLIIYFIKDILVAIIPSFSLLTFNMSLIYISLISTIFFVSILKVFQANKIFRAYNFFSVLNLLLQLVCLILVILFFRSEMDKVLLLWCIAISSTSLLALIYCFFEFGLPTFNRLKEIINNFIYSLKIHLLEFPIQLENQLGVLVLFSIAPLEAVGIFGTALAISQIIFYLTNTINLTLFPYLVGKESNLEDDLIEIMFLSRLSIFTFFIYSLLIFFLGEFLISLVYGEVFVQAYLLILILLPGIALEIVFRYLCSWLKARNEVLILSPLGIGSLALNILLIVYLYSIFSIKGAALAVSITFCFRTIFLLSYSHKFYKTGFLSFLILQRSDFLRLSSLIKKVL